jgi:hypothetical protein
MGRSDFDAEIHEIGELREFVLDIAFGPAAIDHEHEARLPHLHDGEGGRGMAVALAPGDDEKAPETGDWPETSEKESSIARAERTSAALAFDREKSRSSFPGRRSKAWPLAL